MYLLGFGGSNHLIKATSFVCSPGAIPNEITPGLGFSGEPGKGKVL
jgi:hypothetical protein